MAGHAPIAEPARPLRFGPGGRFELRAAEYRLLIDGRPAAVGGRALDLLIALAARPQQVLSKDELLETVWRGLVVEENNLRVQVNALRRLLGDDAIATVPGRGYRLCATLAPELEPATDESAVDGPALDGFPAQRLFGRAADLAQLEGCLREPGQCVTLVGMPGVGKSSLARAAATRWPTRSTWVDLAPLTQTRQVGGAIARALDVQLDDGDPVAQLFHVLPPGEPPLLLVLDNAEHLVGSCAEWASRLRAVSRLRLLVTSQVPLSIADETALRIEPLTVADDDPAGDGALALLIDRIKASDRRFRVTPDALPLLRALCTQLDGLPLALEMAAARVPLMGVRAVHDALAERFSLLARGRRDAPARHHTLRDALAWSYGLLAAPEQRLFRALGVFAGGFTLDLAVTTNADEHVGRWDIVDGLATLVERSLVGVDAGEPPRYRLLETMRAYALEQLRSPEVRGGANLDEHGSARRRHAQSVLALVVRGASESECLAEMQNVREALLWAQEHDLGMAAQISAGAARVIGFSAWRQEVTDWMLGLQPVMDGAEGDALSPRIQANWWSMLAYVLQVRRDRGARLAAKRAVSLWRELDDPARLQEALGHRVRSLSEPGAELDEACAELLRSAAQGFTSPRDELRVQGALAEAARVRGDHPALLACREHELRLAREIGWIDMAEAAETNVCAALIELGRHAEAAERARALLQRIEAGSDRGNGNLPWALYMLGEALLRLHAFDEARTLVPRMLAAERRFGSSVAWHWILALAVEQGRLQSAARLLGYVRQLWTVRKDSPDLGEPEEMDRVATAVRKALGTDAAEALAAEGRFMGDDAAAALAAAETD